MNKGQKTIRVLDDVVTEVAKIGAQGVEGVRVVSAKVEELDSGRLVHLVVDAEFKPDLSDALNNVRKKAIDNIAEHLPEEAGIQVNVTVANVYRPPAGRWSKIQDSFPKILGFLKSELGPWMVPLLFLCIGVGILWTITSLVNDQNTTLGDVVLALLLVMPILIYALISGRLTELKGPGGVEAKFTGVATRPVAETASHDLVSFITSRSLR